MHAESAMQLLFVLQIPCVFGMVGSQLHISVQAVQMLSIGFDSPVEKQCKYERGSQQSMDYTCIAQDHQHLMLSTALSTEQSALEYYSQN